MELEKTLAMVSLCITAAAVLLFAFFPPSSPELSFVLAIGVSFVLLLLFSLSVMEAPEGEEGVVPEAVEEGREEVPQKEEAPGEKGEEVIKLKEALEEEKGEEARTEERREEKPQPDLFPWLGGFSPPEWKPVGEGRAGEETLLGKGAETGAKGSFRIWEREGRRLALYTLLFPSSEAAEARVREMMDKLGGLLQERLPQGGRFYLEGEGIDGMLWRKGDTMFLLLLGKGEKGETSRFLEFLPENLRPVRT
jgi:hypothetical protein